jgi:hypothetical protein
MCEIIKSIKKIYELEITELFSFSRTGAVHMVSNIRNGYIEYKSYEDGKIRIAYLDREKPVFTRLDFEKRYELKWFKL